MKGYSPKFEGKRSRIGGVREVSDFSANLEFSANLKVTLKYEFKLPIIKNIIRSQVDVSPLDLVQPRTAEKMSRR